MGIDWTALKAFLLGVVNVLALFGNISLFVVLLRKPALRTQSNMFLLNLAVADLLVSVVNMPMTNATLLHGSWMFGEFVCTLTAYINLLSLVASVMSLAMVSVNRYHHVVKGWTYQQHFSKRKCAVYIALVWVISAVLCFPPLLGWAEYRYIAGQSQCFVDWSSSPSYMFFMVGVCFFGPLSVMASVYWKIWKFTSASVANVSSWKDNDQNLNRDSFILNNREARSPALQTRGPTNHTVPKVQTDGNMIQSSHKVPSRTRGGFCTETENEQNVHEHEACSTNHTVTIQIGGNTIPNHKLAPMQAAKRCFYIEIKNRQVDEERFKEHLHDEEDIREHEVEQRQQTEELQLDIQQQESQERNRKRHQYRQYRQQQQQHLGHQQEKAAGKDHNQQQQQQELQEQQKINFQHRQQEIGDQNQQYQQQQQQQQKQKQEEEGENQPQRLQQQHHDEQLQKEPQERQNRHHQRRQPQRQETITKLGEPNITRSNLRSEPKLTTTLIIVVSVFCICWAPYAFTIVLEHFLLTPLPTAVSFGVLLLGYANSACNVLIYISTCRRIRKEFKEMFRSCRFCL